MYIRKANRDSWDGEVRRMRQTAGLARECGFRDEGLGEWNKEEPTKYCIPRPEAQIKYVEFTLTLP
jgi:hypothetical protein